MKIFRTDSDPQQIAIKFPYRNGAPARFPAYRYEVAGREKNTLQEEVAFERLEDAADFIVRHPGSAIRMMPGRALVSVGLVIDIDADEPEAAGEPIDDDA
ncbi:hypothetical protein [Salipiger aestuarii]|jgi:hypothetical protein|uniref:hypothetical protein n=1 Tax=Salipiger aestuarii TaxID=568098 RepID=UPI001238A87E|nr:hypothetical protein [Salipiger aestuarii]